MPKQDKSLIRDIYHPEHHYFDLDFDATTQRFKKVPKKESWWHRGFVYGGLAILMLVLGLYGFRLFIVKGLVDESTAIIYTQLKAAQTALADLDPEAAKVSFAAARDELESIASSTNRYGVLSLTSSVGGKFFAQLRDLPQVFKELIGVSQTAVDISKDIGFLKDNALTLVLNQRGPELITRLKAFESKIETLLDYTEVLQSRKAQLGSAADFLPELRSQLSQASEVTSALISFLDSPKDQDLLVLLQNSSEIRPGGGFIGSYAHLVLDHASLTDIEVVDIYDPDGQLDLKIIPPKPLQRITTAWGARDGNWFFDFPTSANQVMDLLNSSKIYQERGVTFDSAVAVNVQVFNDIFSLVEPIDLPEYDLSLTADNFLEKIQYEVEAGADKAAGEPKRILKVLAPMIANRLSNLQDSDKKVLANMLSYHIRNRNIMAYVNNPILESYFQKVGLGGEVAQIDEQAPADYLAVVNANIAGQKTDIFIDQSIDLQSTIEPDGTISDRATVRRQHSESGKKEWWYNSTNKDYLQVFTPRDSLALSTSGQSAWPDPIVKDYSGFETDGDLAQIYSTFSFSKDLRIDQFEDSAKQVFAAWLNTPTGKTREFTIEYQLAKKLDLTQPTVPLRVIFERQSGVATSFSYTATAPVGFVWKESGDKTFEYQDDDPPGRLILDLTLLRQR